VIECVIHLQLKRHKNDKNRLIFSRARVKYTLACFHRR